MKSERLRVMNPASRMTVLAVAAAGALALAGCQDSEGLRSGKAYRPIPSETLALMGQMGATKHSPILIRAFKKEAELEIWKMKPDGQYALLKTYPMCRWSGQLGPKVREGDRQVPEGFYAITPSAMNPNSAFYLSFNLGYPNAYDRSHSRTGSLIMVHGACSSRGCFSMTDEQMAEIYAITREAFAGGQQAIQMQSLPFRMTPENLAKHRYDPHMPFWRMLKEGADHFDVTKREPQISVCSRRYVFNSQPEKEGDKIDSRSACPSLRQEDSIRQAVAAKQSADNAKVAAQIAKGVKPVKVVYADGGQHSKFTHVMMVSRPDALAAAPREIVIDAKGKPVPASATVQVAAAPKPAPAATPAVTASASAPASAVAAPATTPSIPPNSTAVARSEPSSTAPAGAPPQASAFAPQEPATGDRPFYQRWFGRAEVPQTTAPVEPAVAQPPAGAVPLPPRRAASPAATGPRADALPSVMRGAQPVLPSSLMGYAPVSRR